MDFFEATEKRRSVRKFTNEPFPHEKIEKALRAAVLAPNSSNMQTWNFHWIQNKTTQQKVVKLCMNQSGARTASQLLVVTADHSEWKRSHPHLMQFVKEWQAPAFVQTYYKKTIPLAYSYGFLNCLTLLKWVSHCCRGLFKPVERGPCSKRDLQEIAVKSAALACENFMLAITAQGGATLPMEGFDSWRLKKLLGIKKTAAILMVIGIGYEAQKTHWGPRTRLPLEKVIHIH